MPPTGGARWIAGPERRTTRLTPEEGLADDAAIRAAGEFCRPPMFPTNNVPNNEGECRQIRPAPRLRRSFEVTKPVARARIYTSGLAYNDLSLNGTRTGGSVLDPGFTDYSRTVLYTTHDVTRLLRRGENVLASELGSGQFDNATRTWDWGWDIAEWRATPRLRLDLWITYTDGSEQLVELRRLLAREHRRARSATTATTSGRPTTRGARSPGWNRPGFDAAAGRPRGRSTRRPGHSAPSAQEPIRVVGERGLRARAPSRRRASSSTTSVRT